ncbi:MAG TPA: hypothetical protein DIC52_18000 [Candidatus Latescibacteria bacterium]|jgi:hypothetical protein|nr:hypothetical protein [Candidatus Latescibacterota bacterium]|tara:strand:- start:2162 stop:2539 length:378 start_codon:yes stop_codon:yes gene_type:complete
MTTKVRVLGVIIVLALGCSNDVETPTAYHQSHLAMPTDVEASLNGDGVGVTWQIESIENVAGFVVSFTDATGSVITRSVEDSAARSLADNSVNTESGSIIQVQVRAFDENGFLGQLSTIVSLSVD